MHRGQQLDPLAADALGIVGLYTSLKLDGNGRLRVSYQDWENADLKYATCAAQCTLAASWRSTTVVPDSGVGRINALVLGADGRVGVIYRDDLAGGLKYIE